MVRETKSRVRMTCSQQGADDTKSLPLEPVTPVLAAILELWRLGGPFVNAIVVDTLISSNISKLAVVIVVFGHWDEHVGCDSVQIPLERFALICGAERFTFADITVSDSSIPSDVVVHISIPNAAPRNISRAQAANWDSIVDPQNDEGEGRTCPSTPQRRGSGCAQSWSMDCGL